MIKCYANKHDPVKKVSVDADGTIEEIADDIANITHAIYDELKKYDSRTADEFKSIILGIFAVEGTAWMTHEELLEEG